MNTYYLIGGAILIAAVLLRVRTKDHLQSCIESINSLLPGRLENIVDYIEFQDEFDESGRTDRDFWRESGGVRGLFRRILEVRHVLRVLQASVVLGFVNSAEAAEVKRYAYKQVGYSLLALPEAARCWLSDGIAHTTALQAARFHWLTTSLTITLCQVQGAPDEVLRYGAML